MRTERLAVVSRDFSEKQTKRYADVSRAFWRQTTAGKWDIDVRPFMMSDERKQWCHPSVTEYCRTQTRAQVAEDAPDYKPTRRHVLGGYVTGGAKGAAPAPGTDGAVFIGGSAWSLIHEQAHSFGLGHSNTPGKEYGDTTTIMGSRAPSTGLSTPQAWFLGLTEEPEIASGQIWVVPHEMHPAARREGERAAWVIQTGHNEYHWIATRPTRGHPYIPGSDRPGFPVEPVVQIIKTPIRARMFETTLMASLKAGEAYSVTPDVTVTHLHRAEPDSSDVLVEYA